MNGEWSEIVTYLSANKLTSRIFRYAGEDIRHLGQNQRLYLSVSLTPSHRG